MKKEGDTTDRSFKTLLFMGVLRCNRNGCDNMGCDRYSTEHGYICPECFEELVDTGPTTDIKEFMDTPKQSKDREAEARARYNAVFHHRENM